MKGDFEVHPLGTRALLVETIEHLRRFSTAMRQDDAARNFRLADRVEQIVAEGSSGPATLKVTEDGAEVGFKR